MDKFVCALASALFFDHAKASGIASTIDQINPPSKVTPEFVRRQGIDWTIKAGQLDLQNQHFGPYPSMSLARKIDPARPSVASDMAYSAMTRWRPWMKMGDIPGHTSSNGFGRRAFKMADLPADYSSLLKQEHPDVFENAEALLDQYPG